jgi:hypothetical protein
MHIVIKYNGNTYTSAPNNDKTAEEVAEMFYEDFIEMGKFKMLLNDGGVLLIGSKAVQEAVFIFMP